MQSQKLECAHVSQHFHAQRIKTSDVIHTAMKYKFGNKTKPKRDNMYWEPENEILKYYENQDIYAENHDKSRLLAKNIKI